MGDANVPNVCRFVHSPRRPEPPRRLARIIPMRFPVVLFDLDGTLVDSGAMILASMRHATRTVLAREIPDD